MIAVKLVVSKLAYTVYKQVCCVNLCKVSKVPV